MCIVDGGRRRQRTLSASTGGSTLGTGFETEPRPKISDRKAVADEKRPSRCGIMVFAYDTDPHGKEAFQVTISTRSRRPRQRPRTKRIHRHQNQTMLWPDVGQPGPVFRRRQIKVKAYERGDMTSYGGLSLAHELASRLRLDRLINDQVGLIRCPVPYHDSDHVLTHVYNLYVGGQHIEDIGHLQHSDAIKRLFGACRIPDPTTAGDYLRRFGADGLNRLQTAIDDAREKVWRQLRRNQRQVATIDIDSTVKPVYGQCKQGADFSYNGKWSYHPLLLTLAQTNEPLRTINRPGNAASAKGASHALAEVLPRVKRHFKQVRVRGDTAFYQRAIIAECERAGAQFAFGMNGYRVLLDRAETLGKSSWKPFAAHPQRPATHGMKRRRKRPRYRQKIARRRGYRTLDTTTEWVAEFEYVLPHIRKERNHGMARRRFRVIVKRQLVEVSQGQDVLFNQYRYRFIITNIPKAGMDASAVVRFAYGRCDQENTIEQMKNGIQALRMPTGELLSNAAFLMCGQLAWCLRSWLSLLALPDETLRYEWSWFRHAFVYIAAKITESGRQAYVRLAGSHRFTGHLVTASQRLKSFEFQ